MKQNGLWVENPSIENLVSGQSFDEEPELAVIDPEGEIYSIEDTHSVKLISESTDYLVTGTILKKFDKGTAKLGSLTFEGEPGSVPKKG